MSYNASGPYKSAKDDYLLLHWYIVPMSLSQLRIMWGSISLSGLQRRYVKIISTKSDLKELKRDMLSENLRTVRLQ